MLLAGAAGSATFAATAAVPAAIDVEQYFDALARAMAALDAAGAPLAAVDARRLAVARREGDVAAAEAVLDGYTLAQLDLAADGRVRIAAGAARPTLVEQGWRAFLLRLANPAARRDHVDFSTGWFFAPTPARLMPGSGSFVLSQRAFLLDTVNPAALIELLGLRARLCGARVETVYGMEVPLVALSGAPVEYLVVEVFSRDPGLRRGLLSFTSFPAAGIAGDSAARAFEFDCAPARDVVLGVRDADGRGCMAALIVRDAAQRIYPPLEMRLAPDMAFHEQVYRADGETLRLPDGDYWIEARRGPEYLVTRQSATIAAGRERIDVQLARWIDPANLGWYSGDTHLHASGCAHYQVPTFGVAPQTMIRHLRGEGLAVGGVLSWGPGWYDQAGDFTALATSPAADLEHPELQRANNVALHPRATPKDDESVLKYDAEISGFPSSHAGHVILLGLRERDYPGATRIEDWPSWNLPVLRWARAQGAVVGYAHCGFGMAVDSNELPNHEIPSMNGIGTQEAIVDVTHGLVDFLAGGDTTPVAELNAWYHLLNCGFRLAFVGETDYPCLSTERVGVGRSYVQLDAPPRGDAGYRAWLDGLRRGRLYCGDGRSHFLAFTVNGLERGRDDVRLAASGMVEVRATVAACLQPEVTVETEWLRAPATGAWVWGWHLEKARIGATRHVAVELVVNGSAVDRAVIEADGRPQALRFDVRIERSAWLALRILPSGHTAPVFVTVAGRELRASRRSAQWCRDCVDRIWEAKAPLMRAAERPEAARAFDHARRVYDAIVAESDVP